MVQRLRTGMRTRLPKGSSTTLESGELSYWDSSASELKTASQQTDQLSEEANQELFARNFAGVVESFEGDLVMVDSELEVEREFDCVSDTYEPGDLLGISEETGTQLSGTVVEKVGSINLAIAVVTRRESSNVTEVKGRLIRSVFAPKPADPFLGNVNTEALSGTKTLTIADPRIHFLDPDGAGKDVLLPPEAEAKGVVMVIVNTANGAEDLTVKDDGNATTIGTVSQNEAGIFVCNGVAWKPLVGANT